MKTLSDLKRDLTVGKTVILKSCLGVEKNEKRTVFKLQSNNVCFLKEDGKSKSWLELPKASLLEYDGKTIKIFRVGIRELTQEEKDIIAKEPKDEKQEGIDIISDGSVMYNRRKHYYKDVGKFYLFGTEKEQGKRLTHADKTAKIEDDSIKGELELVYEVN